MFGMFLWELMTKERPFNDVKDAKEVKKLVGSGQRPFKLDPSICPESLWTLIERCWNQDPNRRLQIEEVHQSLEVIIISIKRDEEKVI